MSTSQNPGGVPLVSARESFIGSLSGPGMIVFNTTTGGGDLAMTTDEGLSSTLEERY
jgi:hypothetical protein